MVPLLTVLFNLVGMMGCYVGVGLSILMRGFSTKMLRSEPSDIYNGMIKSCIFGGILTLVDATKDFTQQGELEALDSRLLNLSLSRAY